MLPHIIHSVASAGILINASDKDIPIYQLVKKQTYPASSRTGAEVQDIFGNTAIITHSDTRRTYYNATHAFNGTLSPGGPLESNSYYSYYSGVHTFKIKFAKQYFISRIYLIPNFPGNSNYSLTPFNNLDIKRGSNISDPTIGTFSVLALRNKMFRNVAPEIGYSGIGVEGVIDQITDEIGFYHNAPSVFEIGEIEIWGYAI